MDDYISRQNVSNWLKRYGQDVLHGKYKFSLMYIWKNLMALPAADVVPVVHGEWIRESWHSRTVRKCSNCHVNQTVTVYDNGEEEKVQYKYCPYCGAKMNGERKE